MYLRIFIVLSFLEIFNSRFKNYKNVTFLTKYRIFKYIIQVPMNIQ
jgi:hypothetical protein